MDVQRDALVARSQLVQRPAEQLAPAASTTGSARKLERSLLNLSAKTFGRVPLTAIIRRCDARCEHCLLDTAWTSFTHLASRGMRGAARDE